MSIRRSLGISAFSQFSTFAINFASVIIVSRLLTPSEIGIFSVAASILAFAHVFREFGVGQFLIQAKEITRERLRAAFTVTLAISWAIAALLLLLRHPAAAFYDNAGVAGVLGLISINFVILPFGSPLLSLLRRELQFDKIALVNIANALVASTVTVITAYMGESYLSMAWGAIAGNIANVVLLNFIRRGQIFMLPTTRGLGEVVRFGSMASTSSLLTELGSSAPDLILGRTLGFADVAFFSRADALRKMTLGQLFVLVRGVYFPSFAKRVREGGHPGEMYCSSMPYMIAFTAPALALLALLAGPLILFLFGHQWERAAPLASLLCGFAVLSTSTSMVSTSLTAVGKVDVVMRAQLWLQGVRMAALASSLWWPLEGVVLAFSLAYVVELLLYFKALNVVFDVSARQLWQATRSSYLLVLWSLAGPVLVLAADDFLGLGLPPLPVLCLALPLAAIGWLAGVQIHNHPLKPELGLILTRLRLWPRR